MVAVGLGMTRVFAAFEHTDAPMALVENCLIFAAYLVSFLLGNISYLGLTYPTARVPSRRFAFRAVCDVILLMLNGGAFAGMALSLSEPVRFRHWLLPRR
jgi:hypothetical protein